MDMLIWSKIRLIQIEMEVKELIGTPDVNLEAYKELLIEELLEERDDLFSIFDEIISKKVEK